MKLFVDSANLDDIEEAVARGAKGITTNPTLMAREGVDVEERTRAIVRRWGYLPVSIELTETEPARMLDQALAIGRMAAEYNWQVTVKVPIGWDWLSVVTGLHCYPTLKTNVTACMTVNQAILAANAGADYVSLFWNRIKDGGDYAPQVVSAIRRILKDGGSKTEIIVGSIRQPEDVTDAFASGAHIVTVPITILRQMSQHPQTDKVVAQFMADYRGTLANS